MTKRPRPRSRLEMEQDVVIILAKRPMKQTEVMYRANLIWKYVSAILPRLVERQLIVHEGAYYRLTPQGFEAYKQTRMVRELFGTPIPNPHN